MSRIVEDRFFSDDHDRWGCRKGVSMERPMLGTRTSLYLWTWRLVNDLWLCWLANLY